MQWENWTLEKIQLILGKKNYKWINQDFNLQSLNVNNYW